MGGQACKCDRLCGRENEDNTCVPVELRTVLQGERSFDGLEGTGHVDLDAMIFAGNFSDWPDLVVADQMPDLGTPRASVMLSPDTHAGPEPFGELQLDVPFMLSDCPSWSGLRGANVWAKLPQGPQCLCLEEPATEGTALEASDPEEAVGGVQALGGAAELRRVGECEFLPKDADSPTTAATFASDDMTSCPGNDSTPDKVEHAHLPHEEACLTEPGSASVSSIVRSSASTPRVKQTPRADSEDGVVLAPLAEPEYHAPGVPPPRREDASEQEEPAAEGACDAGGAADPDDANAVPEVRCLYFVADGSGSEADGLVDVAELAEASSTSSPSEVSEAPDNGQGPAVAGAAETPEPLEEVPAEPLAVVTDRRPSRIQADDFEDAVGALVHILDGDTGGDHPPGGLGEGPVGVGAAETPAEPLEVVTDGRPSRIQAEDPEDAAGAVSHILEGDRRNGHLAGDLGEGYMLHHISLWYDREEVGPGLRDLPTKPGRPNGKARRRQARSAGRAQSSRRRADEVLLW